MIRGRSSQLLTQVGEYLVARRGFLVATFSGNVPDLDLRPSSKLALELNWKTVLKSARENRSKATDIENAVYDLKAVNPNRKVVTDTRTPAELLDFIKTKGREADAALSRLRTLISTPPPDEPDYKYPYIKGSL